MKDKLVSTNLDKLYSVVSNLNYWAQEQEDEDINNIVFKVDEQRKAIIFDELFIGVNDISDLEDLEDFIKEVIKTMN